ncbi:MAG: hypothetical protein J6P03_03640 [Opitutales bacterium]|nr:hypothetical protein [Opitutales bacterium]
MKKLTVLLFLILTFGAVAARPEDPRKFEPKDNKSCEFEVYVGKTRERYKDALITSTSISLSPSFGGFSGTASSVTAPGKVKIRKPKTVADEIKVVCYYEYKGKEYAGILLPVLWQGKIVEEFPFLIKSEDLATFNKHIAFSCSKSASGLVGRALRLTCVKISAPDDGGEEYFAFLISRW